MRVQLKHKKVIWALFTYKYYILYDIIFFRKLIIKAKYSYRGCGGDQTTKNRVIVIQISFYYFKEECFTN